ncbi:MAG: hypothetical protein RIM99_19545 [Cyclobacteriaceae bacterium]
MNTNFEKSAGTSLIIGSILMIITMVLHPVGGDFQHLLSIVTIAVISHSIAVLSIPFVAYGFWGITSRLDSEPFLSRIAFSFMFFGLVAVMIAAALNGMVLTGFIQRYADATPEIIESIRPIMTYNFTLNHAFDFIYIGAVCISTLFWSVAILKTKSLPVWTGYFGLLLTGVAVVLLVAGFVFVDVHGFRLFIFGAVAWTISVGFLLRKS